MHSVVERRPMVPPGVAPVTNRKRFRASRGEAAYIPLDLTGVPQTERPPQTSGGLIAAGVTACHAGRVGPRACARPLLWAEP